MLKKCFYAFIFILLLTACGQSADLNNTNEEVDDTNASAEPSTTSNAAENNDIASNDEENMEENSPNNDPEQENNSSDETSEPDTDTSESLSDLEVHYIDVGQADATLFQFDGNTILYDTGDWNRNDVIHYLDAKGVADIDLVVISHPHADHIGQLAEVMHTYQVGEVWFNGAEASSQTFQNALTAVLESDADFAEPRAGEKMQIGSMDIEVLHPNANSGDSDLNRDSLSLRFTYGDISFVFTGDAYKQDERAMMANVKSVQADILQLGHHGSKTSSDAAFIEAVSPDVAIYSAGTDNSYGHPSPETVSLIQDAGITLYGTDAHGTIIVTTDGQTYDIQTKEDGTITPSSTGSTSGDEEKKTSEEEKTSNDTPTTDHCISINEASAEELQEIIHIGPVRAEDVIDARPFDSVSDLTKVKGIGPSRIADIDEQGLACTGG